MDLLHAFFLQFFMWFACATQLFLLGPDCVKILKTRNTCDEKTWKFLVWIFCSCSWIVYAIFLLDETSIIEIIGLIVSEAFNIVCVVYMIVMKIINIKCAKKMHLSEEEWYAWYTKEKEKNKKTKKIYGTIHPNTIKKIRRDKKYLSQKIVELFKNPNYKKIINKRVIESKVYKTRVLSEYKKPIDRLNVFLDIASTSEIALFYSLILQDLEIKKNQNPLGKIE